MSVAVALPAGDEDDHDIPFVLEPGAGTWRLTGTAPYVLDAPGSDRLLVPARSDGGVVIVEAGPETPGIDVVESPVVDRTRRFGSVTARSAPIGAESVHRFAGDPWAGWRRVRERGAVAMACDSLGIAEAMLEATVAYAGAREQFGRPIGSFQAVQHACADMLVQVSMSRELVSAAVRSVAGDEPGAPVTVSMAKSYACAAGGRRRRQGDAAARRHRVHVGEWHSCLPQAGGAQPVALRLAHPPPAEVGPALPPARHRGPDARKVTK